MDSEPFQVGWSAGCFPASSFLIAAVHAAWDHMKPRLGIPVRYLALAERNGDLAGYRPGQRVTYHRWSEVCAWWESRRVTQRNPDEDSTKPEVAA